MKWTELYTIEAQSVIQEQEEATIVIEDNKKNIKQDSIVSKVATKKLPLLGKQGLNIGSIMLVLIVSLHVIFFSRASK